MDQCALISALVFLEMKFQECLEVVLYQVKVQFTYLWWCAVMLWDHYAMFFHACLFHWNWLKDEWVEFLLDNALYDFPPDPSSDLTMVYSFPTFFFILGYVMSGILSFCYSGCETWTKLLMCKPELVLKYHVFLL